MSEPKGQRPDSVYERIIVAAQEAKRLNDRQLATNVTPRKKVTTEAIRRVEDGEVDYEHEEGSASDEAGRDSGEADPSWTH